MTEQVDTVQRPSLVRRVRDGVAVWTDEALAVQRGVLVAFSEREGGVSVPPFASLNVAAHVGDAPGDVDENRSRLFAACGCADTAGALTMADQVHGKRIVTVGVHEAGSGRSAGEGGRPPIPACDALITSLPRTPLLLCFADCVPIVVVAPGPVVAVVHAGWRGVLAGLPFRAVGAVAEQAGCTPLRFQVYIGAHICHEHFTITAEIMSHFVEAFGTVARAESGGLDLGAVVDASLTDAGVDPCNIARLGVCTAEATDRFFSYRAEGGLTGRHGALACIVR